MAGGSYWNPIDVGQNWDNAEELLTILDALEEDPNVDIVVVQLGVDIILGQGRRGGQYSNLILDNLFTFKAKSARPLLVITPQGERDAEAGEARKTLAEKGIPSFPTFERAAKAISKAVGYYRWHAAFKN
jgi:acyl-CoA synthetase (NDP forming)